MIHTKVVGDFVQDSAAHLLLNEYWISVTIRFNIALVDSDTLW
jgi:hypothetical protein